MNRLIEGMIFDFDDTLLDTQTKSELGGLHERSRLAAIHEVGRQRGLLKLMTVSPEENKIAFSKATVHSVEGAIWRVLFEKGLVADETVDDGHELLLAISGLKNQFHEPILKEFGKEVPGARNFLELVTSNGPGEKMAIASMAVRRDIDAFFEMSGMQGFFPSENIVSRELINKAKPHPEAFDTAFRRLSLPDDSRRQVLAFEDDPRGIESARLAGLFTCAITTRYSKEYFASQTNPPDLIADSFAEFALLLELR